MIRRPPRSPLSSSSAASDVYKRQVSTQSTGRHGCKMGCGGSKESKGSRGNTSSNADQRAANQDGMLGDTDRAHASEVKRKQCEEIVDHLDSSGDGVLQAEELQLLVKHLYPNFINVCVKDIPLDDPKIKALDGKTKAELVEHLNTTCDDTWVNVFHQFIGKGEKKQEFAACKPGVYSVCWEGGVRYRLSPNYQDIADEEQLALPDTHFDIEHFAQGPLGLWYAYIHWARYWVPVTFQDGRAMLERIGDNGSSEQLQRLAEDLFNEIDASKDGYAEWEEITSFLDGAAIAYDAEALKGDFVRADVDGNQKLDLKEFIECYKNESISNVFCIPTYDRQAIPHPEGEIADKEAAKAAARKERAQAEASTQ
eukprot:TRINITY_DN799_c0_g1_i5.p1 TRINITY_DN799_c0_g1~~TRINITY_DN799_c0_g1_i5.p1  ORF type:complete len:368 (-),score=106.31 TRINITY_DN799_c0_g1_i5:87-1190(-)